MAGDWIKMRVSLVTHPRVIALSEALSYSEAYQDWSGLHGFIPAIGGSKEDFDAGIVQSLRVTRYVAVTALLKFWGYANEHSKDDFIPNLRIADLDEITAVPGFGEAISEVGWAIYDQEKRGISLPNFSEHNASASDRTNAERQKRYRERQKAASASVTENNNVTKRNESNDREEKRREEKKNTSPKGDFSAGFQKFWESWPASDRKVAKAKCAECWKRFGLDSMADAVVAHVVVMRQSEQWQKGFEPAPLTYLNQRRWQDAAETPAKPREVFT